MFGNFFSKLYSEPKIIILKSHGKFICLLNFSPKVNL